MQVYIVVDSINRPIVDQWFHSLAAAEQWVADTPIPGPKTIRCLRESVYNKAFISEEYKR